MDSHFDHFLKNQSAVKNLVHSKNEVREKRSEQDDIDGSLAPSKTHVLLQNKMKLVQQEENEYAQQNKLKLAGENKEENATALMYRMTFKEIFDESFVQDEDLKLKFADTSRLITKHFNLNDEEEKTTSFTETSKLNARMQRINEEIADFNENLIQQKMGQVSQ
jgi:hypothetical protein